MADQDVQAKLESLRRAYRDKLSTKLSLIDQYEHEGDLTHLKELSHQLAGTAGTYGFSKISADMKSLELDIADETCAEATSTEMKGFFTRAREIIHSGLEKDT